MLKHRTQNNIFILIVIFMIALLPSVAQGWDNKTTHIDLSDSSVNNSVLNKGYLVNNLRLQRGILTSLQWNGGTGGTYKTIQQWIEDGANYEDGYNIFTWGRVFNHFHNPMSQYTKGQNSWNISAPWNCAGLDDAVFWQFSGADCGESALLWAQDGASQISLFNDDWSWGATRTHYYNALTSYPKTVRDAELAQTFVGIGHQIHLLQDMSQPAHVRDDAHPEDFFGSENIANINVREIRRFENWAIKFRQSSAHNFIFQANPIFPTVSTANSIGPGPWNSNLVPITAFWDTDQYTSASQVPRAETNVGLAEYTNSNYFSEGTINSSHLWHVFPFPSKDPSQYCVFTDNAPGTTNNQYTRRYLSPGACDSNGNPQSRTHFIADSLINDQQFPVDWGQLILDDNVFKDYAQDLFPHAVGYSAALINYFFRGRLDLQGAGTGGYTIGNRSTETLNPSPGGFVNFSGSQYSTLCIYYDQTGFDQYGNPLLTRLPVTGVLNTSCINVTAAIAPGQSSNPIDFTPPTDNYYPGQYWIVYSGTLGGEDDAVIGSFTGWKEEWDNGLTGNHNWYDTLDDCSDTYCFIPNGQVTEVVQNGELTMSNKRPSGTPNPDPSESPDAYGDYYIGAQANEMFIGIENGPSPDPALQDMFPIVFGPNTVVTFKVDTMTSSLTNSPLQGCGSYTGSLALLLNSSWPAAWQVIEFSFDNGGTPYVIDLTVPGQASPYANLLEYLTPGTPLYFNPYQDMQTFGVTIVPPLKLKSIDIWQQLYGLCSTSTTNDQQSLAVDYIRIMEKTW